MKKILSIFAIVSLLMVLILPDVSLGADVPKGGEIPEGCVMSNTIDASVGCPGLNAVCKQDTEVDGALTAGCGKNLNMVGVCCMLNTIYTVTNWIFYIMTLIAVLMIVYGGFTYITAAGDPAKAGKGKTILTYAIIGLAIALIAKLIPSLVRFIIGV